MKTTKNLTEKALRTWTETRDSDKKLILSVWYLQNNNYLDDFKQFFLNDAIHPDSITRVRRKLQEEGKYPASKDVEEHRFKQYKNMRSYGSLNLTTLEETI